MSTPTPTPTSSLPAHPLAPVRRLPVPDHRPPVDAPDQPGRPGRPGTAPPVQGTLALAFVLPSGLPAAPPPPPGLRLVPAPAEAADDADFGPQPTPSELLPDPQPWAARFSQALAEVLAGDRPVGQLVRWTTGEVYEELVARLSPSALARRESGAARPRLSAMRVDRPADGVAEVTAVLRSGARATAMALRLEGLDGRWQCSALELA